MWRTVWTITAGILGVVIGIGLWRWRRRRWRRPQSIKMTGKRYNEMLDDERH